MGESTVEIPISQLIPGCVTAVGSGQIMGPGDNIAACFDLSSMSSHQSREVIEAWARDNGAALSMFWETCPCPVPAPPEDSQIPEPSPWPPGMTPPVVKNPPENGK